MTDPYVPQPQPQDPYVPQGYLPPANAYLEPAQPGADPNDPLVNPPHSGINGWFTRIGGLFQRSWKSVLAIIAITHIIPVLGFAAIGVVGAIAAAGAAGSSLVLQPGVEVDSDSADLPDWLGIGVGALVVILIVLVFVLLIMQMAGYAAATYAAAKEAVGQPVRLSEALAYGFRRSLGLSGWQIVVWLLTVLGAIACILPAFYVYAATALFGPIYLFERISPIGRTFSIFNNNLGRILGRLAIIMAATLVVGVVGNMFDLIGGAATGNSSEPALAVGAAVLSSLFGLVLQLPLTMFTFAGILLTYTEQRGYEAPVNAGQLAAEL